MIVRHGDRGWLVKHSKTIQDEKWQILTSLINMLSLVIIPYEDKYITHKLVVFWHFVVIVHVFVFRWGEDLLHCRTGDLGSRNPELAGTHLQSIRFIGVVRCLHRAQQYLNIPPTPATVCSPCCHLARDTEVSNVVPPDFETPPH